jgi:PIN domain nuclease of toxin-antitoxin system
LRFLLDTHSAIWALDTPSRLGLKGRHLIEDLSNDILISPVVPWELAIKAKKGKIPLHPLVTDFLKVIQKQEFISIQIDPLHAIRSGLLPLHHRDPFDRLLAAQSLELGVPIISIDAIFDRYSVERIW